MKYQLEKSPPQIGADIVKRLALAYGVRDTAGAIATAMGRPEGTVKNWAGRGSVPLEYLVQARSDTGRTLDWLVLGVEPQSENGRQQYKLAHGALQLQVAEPEARAWLQGADPHPRGERPDIPAPAGGPTPRSSATKPLRALMPVTGTRESRPLVLSMTIGEAGAVDYEVIPKMCGGANGPADGKDALLLDRAGEVAMTYEWLQRNLGHTTGQLASVQVIGDSMQPTLLDGDTIIIDRGVQEFGHDAIYAVHMLGQRLVKRVQRKLDGSVVIISDNSAYERETVPRSRVREIEVLGRMVWPRVR